MTDTELLTAAELQLNEAELALEAIEPTTDTHRALIGQALAAVRAADMLVARVSLAG